jgi:hypothetical protein
MDTKHLREQAELALRVAASITDDVIRNQLKRIAAEHIAQAERWERLAASGRTDQGGDNPTPPHPPPADGEAK